jgi:hypothetical protein
MVGMDDELHERVTALLIPSPWSGDEHDPIPWTYPLWFRLYWVTRRLRHLVGLHDWRCAGPTMSNRYCTWCGRTR